MRQDQGRRKVKDSATSDLRMTGLSGEHASGHEGIHSYSVSQQIFLEVAPRLVLWGKTLYS